MSNSNKILVLGATGLLGSTLVPYLKKHDYNIITHARKKGSADVLFELDDWNASFNCLNSIVPDVIVNLVGLTSVEDCQQQPNLGYLANTRTVENLVRCIKQWQSPCHLIQLSTDHVYDGTGPHKEDQVTLTNNYALTKYAGEIAARQVDSTVLRTNFVGRSKVKTRESLTDWVCKSLTEGIKVRVLSDVLFGPLTMDTLSSLIKLVINKKPLGVYNLGSKGGMSKADFDFYFAEKLGLQVSLMTRIESSEAKFFNTYRPKDMRMDCSRFEKLFDLELPDLRDEIEKATEDYHEKT